MPRKDKTRIIIRPWTPRTVPSSLPEAPIKQALKEAYPKLKKIVYIGWAKRKVNGKRVLWYLAATGETTKEAREHLKKSELYGENVWILYQ